VEEIISKVAQDSAIATVAIFSIWQLSRVTIELARALVEVSTKNAETLSEQAEHLK
jgi:hypothetical protein